MRDTPSPYRFEKYSKDGRQVTPFADYPVTTSRADRRRAEREFRKSLKKEYEPREGE